MSMMARPRRLLLVLALAGCSEVDVGCIDITGACPDDDSVMALCLSTSFADVVRAKEGIAALVESMGGPPPANTTFDVTTGSFEITIPLGAASATLSGVLSSPDDIGNGVDIGEEVTATWTLERPYLDSAATGDGSFTFVRFSPTDFTVSGTGSWSDDEGGCELGVSSLSLTGSSSTDFGTGTLVFSGRSSGGTITGTVTFDGSASADIVCRFQGEDRLWTFNFEHGVSLERQ
jgi:hypothetical protein